MTINEQMVKAMMVGIAPDQVAAELPKKMVAISELYNALLLLRSRSNQARQECDIKQAEIQAAVLKIQEKCPHYVLNFHSDPSGNNDSYQDCSVCGKTF